MTRRERNLLLTGLFIGAFIVLSIFVGRQYVSSQQESTAAAATSSSDGTASEPAGNPDAGSAAAIQLTDQEQKAIGVETAVVKRQAIQKRITAPGKVAEPETGIGTISARVGGRIDKLFINVTGETVSRGDAVALIYS